jgi:hypothetical protein
MNQSIRDYIKRRVRWFAAVAVLGWLMVFLGGLFLRGQPMEKLLPLIGFLVFVGSMLGVQWFARCPRCSARLRQLAFTIGFPVLSQRPNFCPYCGVSLDEPREPQTAGINPIR